MRLSIFATITLCRLLCRSASNSADVETATNTDTSVAQLADRCYHGFALLGAFWSNAYAFGEQLRRDGQCLRSVSGSDARFSGGRRSLCRRCVCSIRQEIDGSIDIWSLAIVFLLSIVEARRRIREMAFSNRSSRYSSPASTRDTDSAFALSLEVYCCWRFLPPTFRRPSWKSEANEIIWARPKESSRRSTSHGIW